MSLQRGREYGIRAFTLVEMLVVVAIIGLLMAILLPSFRSVKRQAEALVCMSNLRQIGFDFGLVVNDPGTLKRWEPQAHNATSFGLTSFIDKVYGTGAYYTGDAPLKKYTRRQGHLFFCPSSAPQLEVTGRPAMEGAVQPNRAVSYAFNGRLNLVIRPRKDGSGYDPWWVSLGTNLLNWPRANRTALVLDVDAAAFAKSIPFEDPHQIAPAVEPPGAQSLYQPITGFGPTDGLFWFPGNRHNGRANVALLDGSVQSSENLLSAAPSINWADAIYDGQWQDGRWTGTGDMLQSLWPEDALNPMGQVH